MPNLGTITTAQLRRELRKRIIEEEKSEKAKKRQTPTRVTKKRGTEPSKKKKKRRGKKTPIAFRVKTFQEDLDDDDDKFAPKLEKPELRWTILKKSVSKLFAKKGKEANTSNYNYQIDPIPLTESTVRFVSGKVYDMAKKQVVDVKKKYPAGANLYARVFMQAQDTGASASVVIKISKLTNTGKPLQDLFFNQLSQRINKIYNTKDYFLMVTDFTILVSGFGKKGGCSPREHHKRVAWGKDAFIHLHNHKSTGNNCLFACFNAAYGVAGNVVKPSSVRKELGLKEDVKVNMKYIRKISDYYNKKLKQKKGYVLINQENEIIKFNHPMGKAVEEYDHRDDAVVRLYIAHEHYFTYDCIVYYKCQECGQKLSSKSSEHTCNPQKASYHNHIITKQKDVVRNKSIVAKSKINYEEVVHWDLETFEPTDGVRHQVYASGFYDKKYKVFYGQDAMDKTIDYFLNMKNKTISAYNGSGFDFYFLIDYLTARGATIEHLLINGGKVMTFEFFMKDSKYRNKVFDLYLFTMSSLDGACKDFKIENAKGTFEHSKMKTWDDVEKYRGEVEPYLKLDVMGLKELFEKFNDVVYESQKCNITQFLTASHMGYSIWQNMPKHVIEIPKCEKKMKFIKDATFGGRTYPNQMLYESPMYKEIKAGTKTYADLKESGEFIYNADATSLYPASMSGFDLVKVKYPLGRSEWVDNPKKAYESGKMGFYEINFKPPTDIRTAVLPRKKMNGNVNIGVEWSLYEGTGIYTSVDIKNAQEAGYEIEFINKALVYEKKGDVFSEYISSFYKMKEKAEREGNDCLRSIAKLLLNSLYGKMLQCPTTTSSQIVNNVIEFEKFMIDYNLTDWKIINNKKLLVTGEKRDYVTAITKPSQLGAYVTAYSRRIMLHYMKAVDPTLKSMIYTYTDTDSLHLSGEAYKKFNELGYTRTKENSQLGFLCNDVKGEGLIIREMNLAPKTYLYEYIDSTGKIGMTMKCKGIPKKCLKEMDFLTTGRVIEFFGMKKKNKLTNADKEKGIGMFSVTNMSQTRTFMKSSWKGMTVVGNQFYPLGYDMSLVEEEE